MKKDSVIDLFESKVKEYRENFEREIKDKISKLKKELNEKNLNQTTDKAKKIILRDLIREKKEYLQSWVVYNEERFRHYLMHHIGFIDNYNFFLGADGFFKAVNPGEVVSPANVKGKREISDLEMGSILRFLEKTLISLTCLWNFFLILF